MDLILDERETQMKDRFQFLKTNDSCVEYSHRPLDLGDILISKDNVDLFILERKTLSDLLASIKDGRYEEQSYRLMHSTPLNNHHIVYIIEGMMSQLHSPIEKKTVYSAIIRLQAFKGFSVIRTNNVNETCDYVLSLFNKTKKELSNGNEIWCTDSENKDHTKDYCSVIKKVKKENVTRENISEILLCQIPGVNNVSAKAILKHYEDIYELMTRIREDPCCLNSITIESKGKVRKLAKNISQNIVLYLGNLSDEKD